MSKWELVLWLIFGIGVGVIIHYATRRRKYVKPDTDFVCHENEPEKLTNPFEPVETDEQRVKRRLKGGQCPDCDSIHFYKGPVGGIMTNIQCAKCGHRFNVVFIDRNNMFAERIEPKTLFKPCNGCSGYDCDWVRGICAYPQGAPQQHKAMTDDDVTLAEARALRVQHPEHPTMKLPDEPR